MPSHQKQFASYHDRTKGCEVLELRCTVCRVVVEKYFTRNFDQVLGTQKQIREAWARHATPPAEGDYEI